MHRLGDDMELDKMSRDAADKYSSPGRPDWDAMSAKLDEVMPAAKRRRFGLLWFVVPAVLLSGGYLLLSRSADNKTAAPAASVSKAAQPGGSINEAQTSIDVAEKKNNTIPPEELSASTKNSAVNPPTAGVNATGIPHRSVQDGLQRRAINRTRSEQPDVPTTLVAPDKRVETPTQQVPAATTTNIDKAITKVDETPQHQNRAAVAKVAAGDAPTTQVKPTPETQQEIVTPARTSNFGKPVIYPPLGKGFSISILAGADKSTVKFRYGNDPGYNLGMLVGYYFNNRWSIHTGAVYTQKNYKMAGEDFNAPKGSVPSYYKLENVEGYCRMWDVPLLARYTLQPRGNNNFYLSAGLSSYFMTSEHYGYFYYYQGNPVTRNMTYPSDDTHLLSILHLSGGFETRMSNRMTLQIEPYAKLPMGGVGFGDIRLSSFGINAALQLRQLSKK